MFLEQVIADLRVMGHSPPTRWPGWDFFPHLTPEARAAAFALIAVPGWCARLPVYVEAQVAVEAIRRAGHHVMAVTAPWLSSPTWDYERRGWLQAHFDIPARDVVLTSRKELVRGAVLVDDKISHCHDWQQINPFGQAFVMRRTWNADEESPCPMINWDAAGIELVLAAAARRWSPATSGS